MLNEHEVKLTHYQPGSDSIFSIDNLIFKCFHSLIFKIKVVGITKSVLLFWLLITLQIQYNNMACNQQTYSVKG